MKSKSLRRSGRRATSAYKRGDYVEFHLNGGTVTGKLLQKSSRGSSVSPVWIIAPSDRRRRNEEVTERSLGKVIDVDEAMNNRQIRTVDAKPSNESQTSSNSDGDESLNESKLNFLKQSSSEDNASPKVGDVEKSNMDDSRSKNVNSERQKMVTFQDGDTEGKKATTRIGTRSSTRNNTDAPEQGPPVKRKVKKTNQKKNVTRKSNSRKRSKKKEEVVKVKMLTGTLYLYRGEHPRAEFVRFR